MSHAVTGCLIQTPFIKTPNRTDAYIFEAKQTIMSLLKFTNTTRLGS